MFIYLLRQKTADCDRNERVEKHWEIFAKLAKKCYHVQIVEWKQISRLRDRAPPQENLFGILGSTIGSA